MATTTIKTLTTSYQQVVTNPDYAIQNISQRPIEFMFKDTEPAATEKGHIIRELDGAITGWGVGTIWARVKAGTGLLAVTE